MSEGSEKQKFSQFLVLLRWRENFLVHMFHWFIVSFWRKEMLAEILSFYNHRWKLKHMFRADHAPLDHEIFFCSLEQNEKSVSFSRESFNCIHETLFIHFVLDFHGLRKMSLKAWKMHGNAERFFKHFNLSSFKGFLKARRWCADESIYKSFI